MRVRVSAQFLLLERSWHRSQGKGGPNEYAKSPVRGTADYDRRRRNIANPPKPIANSEKAEGSGMAKLVSDCSVGVRTEDGLKEESTSVCQ